MWVKVIWLDMFKGTGSGTRLYPGCMNWHFGVYSLWWDTVFSLNMGVRNFILPQLGMPDLLTPQGRPYPLRGVNGEVEVEWEDEGGKGRERN